MSFEIRLWQPRVGNRTISTKEELHNLIDREFVGLKRNSRFSELMRDAELHLSLIEKFSQRTTIQRGEISRIVESINNHKTHNANRHFVTALMKEGEKPRLYWNISQSISKTQARIKLTELVSKNTGLQSLRAVEARLRTYYSYDGLSRAITHKNRLTKVEEYFRVLNLLNEGGLFVDVAKMLGIHRSTVGRWFKGEKRPVLVQLARNIPDKFPGQFSRSAYYQWQ